MKSEPVSKKVKVAKAVDTAPVDTPKKAETETDTENSSIATATLEPSTSGDAEKAPAEKAPASKSVGCKKFFPTVGMTLTVPCE